MGKSYYNKKHYAKKPEGYLGTLLRMLPAVLMVGLVPLIVRQYKYETGLTGYAWFGQEAVSYDFFLGAKAFVLMVLAFVMLGCVAVRFWKEKRKLPFAKILIPLVGYGVLVFVSACASVNRTFSFSGGHEQFESVWALLSYVLIVYYVFLYAESEAELQVVTDALCFGATVIGVIGTFQGLGMDVFATRWFQKLITTEPFFLMVGEKLQLNFTDNYAFATLYNPNYLGVFGSFVVPFLTMLLLYEKNKWRRIWHVANVVLVLVALLSSRSRAGLIAAIAALCVALIFAIRKILKWWYLVIPAVNLAVALVLLINAYNDNIIFDRLKNILTGDNVEIAEEITEDGAVIRKTGLTELYTTDKGVMFTYNEVTAQVVLHMKDSQFGFYVLGDDEKQLMVTQTDTQDVYGFQEPALKDVLIELNWVDELPGFTLKAAGDWLFAYNDENKKYQYILPYDDGQGGYVFRESDMIMAESYGFKNHQKTFSSRGYIWSRSIPLLKDHIFLGSGPDTFVLEYPQEDYLMMQQNGFAHQIMTKPHSWYLQVGVQTGVMSLLCLLVFYGWYAVWSMRLYAFRKLGTQTEAFGIAAFIGSIGYMISGISNDSMVVTAPVFWGMIALGITANFMVSKARKSELAEKKQATVK